MACQPCKVILCQSQLNIYDLITRIYSQYVCSHLFQTVKHFISPRKPIQSIDETSTGSTSPDVLVCFNVEVNSFLQAISVSSN